MIMEHEPRISLTPKRPDYKAIQDLVESGARVLDLGCGEGDLLLLLSREKKAEVQGIELNDRAVRECVKKGLSVFHSDIESGLKEFSDQAFDYVILNQSMQEVRNVDYLLQEALRVGKQAIVGFPNFAHVRARLTLLFCGKAPVTASLSNPWYATPNVRFLSICDFKTFCGQRKIKTVKSVYLGKRNRLRFWSNLFALNAVFVLSK